MTYPEKENCNTYALTKRTTPRQQNRNSSAEAMYRIYCAREGEGRSRQKHKNFQIEKTSCQKMGVVMRETTHGTTGSENCSQDVSKVELCWVGAVLMLYHYLRKDTLGRALKMFK